MKDFAKSIRVGNATDKNGKELKVGDTVLVKTDDPSLNGGKIVRISGSQVSVDVTGDNDIWTTPGNLCTKIGNAKTGNSNKEEIIKKKKEQGATLKVDNGQKLEFSDGTTYVKTSFSDDYREAHNHVGNEDWSDIIRAAKKQLEDAKKFGWAELGYNGWTKEGLKDFEKRIKDLEERQKRENKTGNAKPGSIFTYVEKANIAKQRYLDAKRNKDYPDGVEYEKKLAKSAIKDLTEIISKRKDSIYDLDEEDISDAKKAIEIYKQIGNSKVGNFMHDAKGQVEDMISLSERLVSQGNKEKAKDVLGTMEIIFRQLKSDKDEYYEKYKESDELISKLNRAAIKLKSIV